MSPEPALGVGGHGRGVTRRFVPGRRAACGAAAFLALAATLGACGAAGDSFTIELEEVNESGVNGELELTRAGAHSTRLTVRNLEGGPITGARVMPHSQCPDTDDKFPIKPPTGLVQVDFGAIRRSAERGELVAAFLRNGHYVACGTT
jgi:hypothetical protein